MLSVAKLALGQESYYEQQVALGLDDYYAGRGESPGLWAGSGAAGLDLAGVVADGDLGTLLRGVSPTDGERLRAPTTERTITVRTLDEASGEWRDERKTLAPVAGYDLVFSCPKSVSLLHALTDDEGVRRAISDAHEASWQAALSYLESEACVVRRGRGGSIRERGEGFVAAAFRHRTSRAQDPHLHTHVIVANLARSTDGTWRALDGEAILRTYRLAAGYLYEANLRGELSRALGVRWTIPVKGMAEIEGVRQTHCAPSPPAASLLSRTWRRWAPPGSPPHVLPPSPPASASRRSTFPSCARPGLPAPPRWASVPTGSGASSAASLVGSASFRVSPSGTSPPTRRRSRRPSWCAPWPAPSAAVRAWRRSAPWSSRSSVLLSSRGSAVTRRRAGPPASRPGASSSSSARRSGWRFSAATRARLLRTHHAWRPPFGTPPSPSRPSSTRSWRRPRSLAIGSSAWSESPAPARRRPFGFSATPWVARGSPCSAPRRADGPPTSWPRRPRSRRQPSTPCCQTPVARADCRAGASSWSTRPGWPRHGCSPRSLSLVERAGGKAILVGDPAQPPAVGAGGLYASICDRLGAVRLTENRRQREPAERQALAELRLGDAEGYLGHAARQGRLLIADDPTEAKERLLADWWRAAAGGDLRENVMLAHRRADVRDLNEGARALLIHSGQLGGSALVAGEREFRAGDRVLCRQNDPALGVRNGTRAAVGAVDPLLGIVTLQVDGGPSCQLHARYAAEHLEHGYALTGHAAQGASVERAFVLLRAEGALAEWGYVVASRARTETRLYAVGPELEIDPGLGPSEPQPTPRMLAGALSRPAAEMSALELLGREREDDSSARLAREADQPRRLDDRARLLGELASGGPPDSAPELRRLETERARLGADLAQAETERERAEYARAAIGRFRMVGRAGQAEAARHERTADEAAVRAKDLAGRLAASERLREELVANGAERERWREERLPQILSRLEAVDHELAVAGDRAAETAAPLSARPGPELAAASRTLTDARNRSGPPDPRPEIARLREDWERHERALGAEGARQQRGAERLDQLGVRLFTRDRREEARHLRAAIERSEHAVERIVGERAGVASKLQSLRTALERREIWEREVAPALSARADALEAEIARRVEARLEGIEHTPPAYLTEGLGAHPERGSGARRWREGARAIEGYRERHGITDPSRALGAKPEDRRLLAERRALERTLEEVRGELGYLARAHERAGSTRREPGYERGPRHDLGQGIERGLDHGPRLGMGR